MTETFLKIFEYLVSLGIGAFLFDWWKRYRDKKKNALEVANIYTTGQNLEIQFKTDLHNLVEKSVAPLKEKIAELEGAIVENAVKYAADLKIHVSRMADMEIKLNLQVERNRELEKRIEEERMAKDDCAAQISKLKSRISELEAFKK